MTLRSKEPTQDTQVRCWADIEVFLAPEGVLAFEATASSNVEVCADGVITIREALEPDEPAELRFTFQKSFTSFKFTGVRLAVREGEWGSWTLDTADAYYEETPFKVSHNDPQPPVRHLVLTRIGGLEPPTVNPYFYELEVDDGSRRHRIDPKIYNTGPEPPGRHKGKNG